jgi:hypothetical protein
VRCSDYDMTFALSRLGLASRSPSFLVYRRGIKTKWASPIHLTRAFVSGNATQSAAISYCLRSSVIFCPVLHAWLDATGGNKHDCWRPVAGIA